MHTWHVVSFLVKGCIATAACCLWGPGMSQRCRARDVSDVGSLSRRRRARDAVPVNEAEVVDVKPQEGPLTLLEICQWPQMALCRLCGLFQAVGAAVSAAQHACLFRLEKIINGGLCVNTNYSGMDMPMLALEMMLQQWVHLACVAMTVAQFVLTAHPISMQVAGVCCKVLLSSLQLTMCLATSWTACVRTSAKRQRS